MYSASFANFCRAFLLWDCLCDCCCCCCCWSAINLSSPLANCSRVSLRATDKHLERVRHHMSHTVILRRNFEFSAQLSAFLSTQACDVRRVSCNLWRVTRNRTSSQYWGGWSCVNTLPKILFLSSDEIAADILLPNSNMKCAPTSQTLKLPLNWELEIRFHNCFFV